MSTKITEKITCGVCKKDITIDRLTSTSSFPIMDLDRRPSGKERYDILYAINECPHCHYCQDDLSVVDSKFDIKILESPEYLELLNSKVFDPYQKRTLLSAYINKTNQNFNVAGDSYLLSAWIFDDLGDLAYAKRCRTQAIACYLKEPDFGKELNELLLMIDLLRRIDNFTEAKKLTQLAYRKIDPFTTPQYYKDILDFQVKLMQLTDNKCYSIGDINEF